LLGTCGGGDVKLFAALGAWVGPLLAVFVLAGTLVLVVVLTFLRLGLRTVGINLFPAPRVDPRPPQAKRPGGKPAKRLRQRLLAYSLPVLLSTACVLLWVFRVELQLCPAPPSMSTEGRQAGSTEGRQAGSGQLHVRMSS
jgi:hypothetical protein